MNNFGQFLYKSLPEVYREYDKTGDLKDFINILGEGFDYLFENVVDTQTLYNVDDVDSKFLPLIAAFLGFEYPYDMLEEEQRRFIRIIPHLYKQKGTLNALELIAENIFGWHAEATHDEKTLFKLNENELNDEDSLMLLKNYIIVRTFAPKGEPYQEIRAENFQKIADNFRPINTIIEFIISYFFEEIYDRNQITTQEYHKIFEDLYDEYTQNIVDEYNEIIKDIFEETAEKEFYDYDRPLLLNNENNTTNTHHLPYFYYPENLITEFNEEEFESTFNDDYNETVYINDSWPWNTFTLNNLKSTTNIMNHNSYLSNFERYRLNENYESEHDENIVDTNNETYTNLSQNNSGILNRLTYKLNEGFHLNGGQSYDITRRWIYLFGFIPIFLIVRVHFH